jgi:hypothetical protein
VWAYGKPADLRKGYNGLVGLVEKELGRDPMSGDLFLFVSERRRGCKVLLWEGTGLCIFIEVSLWSREGAGRDRIATLCELQHRTRLWNKAADRARRKINWRFTTADARRVFRYRAGTTPGPKD